MIISIHILIGVGLCILVQWGYKLLKARRKLKSLPERGSLKFKWVCNWSECQKTGNTVEEYGYCEYHLRFFDAHNQNFEYNPPQLSSWKGE